MFSKGSRYENVENYTFQRIDGSKVSIKQKRSVPEPKIKLIHTVQEGQRTDTLADLYYKDPLKFWKLADGNNEMNSERLVAEPGRKITVPANDPD